MLVAGVLLLSAVIAAAVCFGFGAFETLRWLWMLPVSFLGAFVVLGLIAFAYLYYLSTKVDTSQPQGEDDPYYRKITYLYSEAILFILRMRVHKKGLEQVPTDGRFVLVCNHLFDLDPVVLYACLQKSQLAFVSKWENTNMFIIGKFLHKLSGQLINRENDREALKTILRCVQLIKEDKVSIAIFPEGYTSRDGRLQPIRAGALKIAIKAKVPLVVCTLQNTDKVFHNILRLKPTDIHLHVVKVITPEQMQGRTAVDLGAEVFRLMLNDLGPAYAPLPKGNDE